MGTDTARVTGTWRWRAFPARDSNSQASARADAVVPWRGMLRRLGTGRSLGAPVVATSPSHRAVTVDGTSGAVESPSVRGLITLSVGASLAATILVCLPDVNWGAEGFALPKEAVVGVAIPACAVSAAFAHRGRVTVDCLDLLVSALLVVSSLAAALADRRELAGRPVMLSVVAGGTFVLTRHIAGLTSRRRQLALWIAGALLVGALSLLGEAYGVVRPFSMPGRAPGGTLGNRNRMAEMMVIGAPCLFYAAHILRERWYRCLVAATVTAASMCIVLSRCRAAWLTVLILCAIGASTPRLRDAFARLGRMAWVLALCSISGFVGAWVLPNAVEWADEHPNVESLKHLVDYREGTGRGRVLQDVSTGRIAVEHPWLGVGPGGWPVAYARNSQPGDPSIASASAFPANRLAQNEWLGAAAERGLVYMALLASLGGVLACAGWQSCAARQPIASTARCAPHECSDAQLRGWALLMTVLSVGIVGMFDAVLSTPVPAVLISLTCGMLIVMPPWAKPRSGDPGRRTMLTMRLAAMALGCWTAVTAIGDLREQELTAGARDLVALQHLVAKYPMNYSAHLRLAEVWARAGKCGEAMPHIEFARTVYPSSAPVRALSRQCYQARVDHQKGAKS